MADMHSFNVAVAEEVGVNAAILLQSIKWWCEKNRANGKHFHDGLHWTYNSTKALTELYPYLGKGAIASALGKLEERGYIRTGNFNKSAYDRTKWYAITEAGLSLFGESISRNEEMEDAESGNAVCETGEPIPVTDQLQTSLLPDTSDGIPYSEIVGRLNERTGRRYRCTEQVRRLIRARVADGYTTDDFMTVIDKMCDDRMGTDMEKYLRPSTLFAPSHFDDYLNWKVTRPSEGTITNDSTRAGLHAGGFYGDGCSWGAEDIYDG